MLNNFEAKAEVEDNVAKSSHGPVSDVLGSGERIFFQCQIMGEYWAWTLSWVQKVFKRLYVMNYRFRPPKSFVTNWMTNFVCYPKLFVTKLKVLLTKKKICHRTLKFLQWSSNCVKMELLYHRGEQIQLCSAKNSSCANSHGHGEYELIW